MKILMRFLVELANCRCVLLESVLAAMQELVDLGKNEDVRNSEMSVYITMHGLLVLSAELYKENKEAIDKLIDLGIKIHEERSERRGKLAACVAASSEFVSEDDFDRLVEAVVSMRKQVWEAVASGEESPVLLRPYEMSGLAPKLAVNQPEHMLEVPNIEWKMERLDSLPRCFPFRIPLTSARHNGEEVAGKCLSLHDTYILDTLFDEIMTAFDKHVGECAKQLLKVPVMSEDFLPRLVDSMFNRLVRPYAMDRIQEPPKLFFTRLIHSVMALQSSTKPLIEEALKLLISGPKPLVDAGSDIRMEMALADFFAMHLINSDYKWEFDIDPNSPTRQSQGLLRAGIAALLRLSFHQNLLAHLPDTLEPKILQVHSLIPPEPRVNNKSVFEFFRFYPVRLACTFAALLDQEFVTATAVGKYILLKSEGGLREGYDGMVQEDGRAQDLQKQLERAQQTLVEVFNSAVADLIAAYNGLDVDESFDDMRQTLVELLLDVCRSNLALLPSLQTATVDTPPEMKTVISNVEILV
ncbi:hypothetical protein Pmar_PMAR025516 [Perkinsus marinus ATCC 50983]|uniref:Uncharacterized protein n=1 Tax=Perkinsus marinus (strain ATCC 50983 / TXsc) TaxID=423536 RepID=C5LZ99_PERM5|nr:hypothetical protein Pmar_PMAR025516 [Perkinsus marinus ATCC 50983]EEQ97893.1 hypothetical protein Pmar_PMAR025516 [Perkinsus marinus ATCC 50983]|eukprot:XP_002765176.1 hypothetical protein Pmar_PMAR025516 [Perkinsus marinus ATCC 50983]